MATYKQIAKGNWKVTITIGNINGKRKRVSKQGFKTKTEAKKYADQVENEDNKNYYLSDFRNITYGDFICTWYENFKSLNSSSSTKTNYLLALNKYIIPNIGHYKLSELNTIILQSFYNKLIKDYNLKGSTADGIFKAVRGSLNYAKKQNLISNTITNIEKLKDEHKKIECWNIDDANIFLDRIKDTSLYRPVFFTLMTGVRVGELCGIRWSDINLEEKIVSINHQVKRDNNIKKIILTDKLKTETSYRDIVLPDILVDYLVSIKKQLNPSPQDFLIVPRYKNTMTTPTVISKKFTTTLKEYPDIKKITFHGLRHTHATLLIDSGQNIKVVSERLGHKDVTTTLNIYTHTSKDMHKKTALALDKLFKKTTSST